jgi:hypothetical protein
MKAYSLLLLLALNAFSTAALAEDQDVNTTAAYQCTNCIDWCQTSYPGDAAVLDACFRGCTSNYANCAAPAITQGNSSMEYRGVTAVAQPEVTTEVAGLPTATTETGATETPQNQPHCGTGQWWNSTPSKAAQRKMKHLNRAQSKFDEAMAWRTDLNFQLVAAISAGNQREVVKIQRQIFTNEKDILQRGHTVTRLQEELTQMGVPYANYRGYYGSYPQGQNNFDPYAMAIRN